MADHISSSTGGSPYDDNGFEKVLHADISPSAPPHPSAVHYGGVQDHYGPGPSEAESRPQSSTLIVTSGAASPRAVVGPTKQVEEPKSDSGTCCCSWVKSVDPRVLDLVYWRDLKKSGVVFGSALVLLLSLALFSVLSVVAYLSLVILTITVSFRLYKNVMAAVQKTGDGHPFKPYLEMDISVADDNVHRCADEFFKSLTKVVGELRRLFLVDDMVDSLKFGLLLWVLTYFGAWFNGMTLIILVLVAVFTLPKVYETYQVQIDEHVGLVRTKVLTIWKQVQEKLPLPGKKKQA